MTWIIFLIISYIIGIVGHGIVAIIEDDCIETFNDLKESLIDSLAIVPVVNILLLIAYIIIFVFTVPLFCIYKYCGIEKLWNKIKDKKIRKIRR